MASQKSKGPSYTEKSLSKEQLEWAVSKLKRRVKDITELIPLNLHYKDMAVRKVNSKLKETYVDIFGEASRRVAELGDISYPVMFMGQDESVLQQDFIEGLPKFVALTEACIESLEEKLEELGVSPAIAGYGGLDVWQDMHQTITGMCKKKFEDGHYADSVETAYKAINERIKGHVKRQTGKELDGTTLMQQAFSVNNPIIVVADQSTQSGKDEQLGYMNIFAGSMQGIRNPKVHGNLVISEKRARHLLYLASLLMYRLDDAGCV